MEWRPSVGPENGHLRFTVRNAPTKAPPKYDPNSVDLWGFKKDALMALVAAAVQARLPHPAAPVPKQPTPPPPAEPDRQAPEEDHDALLRRLRELGDLHRSGVLTEEEFTMAKQAVLKRMRPPLLPAQDQTLMQALMADAMLSQGDSTHSCPISGRFLANHSPVPQDLPGARRTC